MKKVYFNAKGISWTNGDLHLYYYCFITVLDQTQLIADSLVKYIVCDTER